MAGRGSNTQLLSNMPMSDTVRALLAERRRATQPASESEVLPDQKRRVIQQMLEQRRQSAPHAGARQRRGDSPTSPTRSGGRGKEAELLSPDSSMSFEFDQPQDVDSPPRGTARLGRSATLSGTSPMQRKRASPNAAARAATDGGMATGSAQRLVLDALPELPTQPAQLGQTPESSESLSSRLQSYMGPPAELARHLSPQQRAAWEEIQDALGTDTHSPLPALARVDRPKQATQQPAHLSSPQRSAGRRQALQSQPLSASQQQPPFHHKQQQEQMQDQPHMQQEAAQQLPLAQEQQPMRPSLAELERKLALAMSGMNLHVSPSAHGGDTGGPFDISELWMGQQGSQASASQSQSRTQSEQSNAHDMHNEATSSHAFSGPTRNPQPSAHHRQSKQAGGRPTSAQTTTGVAKPGLRQPTVPAGRHAATGALRHTSQHTAATVAAGQSRAADAIQPPTSGAVSRRGGAAARSHSAPRTRGARADPLMTSTASLLRESITVQAPLLVANAKEFTFKPRINESSREMVRASYPVDLEDRLEQLSVPKTVLLQKYEQVRLQEREAELRECTFAPRTGRPPSPAKAPRSGPVFERLYAQQPAWQQKRQALLDERERLALADCTFKPAVSSGAQRRAASAGRLPLHQRVHEVLRTRNETLSNARIRAELADEGVTFQPSINPRSVQLAAKAATTQGTQGVAAGERMYHEAVLARTTPRRPDQSAEFECTFAPAINVRSRQLVAHSSELPASFLERQEYLAALAAEKRAMFAGAVEEAQRRPDKHRRMHHSGLCSADNSGSWASDDVESGRDRLAKLAYADVRRSAALKDALAKHYYGQFSYTPDINPRSRVIGKTHSIEDLYRNDSGRYKREILAHSAQSQAVAQCTFAPTLNPSSLQAAALRRSGSLLDGLGAQQLLQERAAKLQEARALKQYEQMKECTFTPEVNKGKPATSKKVDIAELPGVAAYLDTQQLAKRKAEEERKRQEQVWWQRPRGSRQLFTVPQPFSFEERQRQMQLAAEADLYDMQAAAPTHKEEAAKISLRRKSRASAKAATISQVLQQAEALEAETRAGREGGHHTTIRLSRHNDLGVRT